MIDLNCPKPLSPSTTGFFYPPSYLWALNFGHWKTGFGQSKPAESLSWSTRAGAVLQFHEIWEEVALYFQNIAKPWNLKRNKDRTSCLCKDWTLNGILAFRPFWGMWNHWITVRISHPQSLPAPKPLTMRHVFRIQLWMMLIGARACHTDFVVWGVCWMLLRICLGGFIAILNVKHCKACCLMKFWNSLWNILKYYVLVNIGYSVDNHFIRWSLLRMANLEYLILY